MSRIANNPVAVPDNVEINVNGAEVRVKGGKGELTHTLHALVGMGPGRRHVEVFGKGWFQTARTLAGTTRAIMQNMVTGVSEGF